MFIPFVPVSIPSLLPLVFLPAAFIASTLFAANLIFVLLLKLNGDGTLFGILLLFTTFGVLYLRSFEL